MDATPHASDGAKSHELTDHHEHGDHQMHAGDRMPVRAPEHRGHDVHAGHSAAMFRDKFWISLLLTLPTLTLPASRTGSPWWTPTPALPRTAP